MFFKKEVTEQTVRITGMKCGHCENAVKKELEKIPGVKEAVADHTAGTAVIKATGPVSKEQIEQAVKEAGFELA